MKKEQKIATIEVAENRVSQQPQEGWTGWKHLRLSNKFSLFGIQTSYPKPKDVLTTFLPLS